VAKNSKSKEVKPVEQKSVETKVKDQKSGERREPNIIQRFFKETIGELRKVSWPTRKEATNLTIIVLGVVFAMAAFLGVLDWVFSQIFRLLLT
jgi:preprotein translocase subunit SecE